MKRISSQKLNFQYRFRSVFLCIIVILAACTSENPTLNSTLSPTEPDPSTKVPTETQSQINNPNQRALWIWNAGVIQSEESVSSLFKFAGDKNISVLYLYAGDVVTNSPTILENFIKLATNNGLKIDLLFGEPGWARTENHSQALALIDTAISFSEKQSVDQRPLGIHIDVEPYGLPEWGTNQDELVISFLDLVSAIQNRVNNASVPLRFSADIPFWFDTVQATYMNETRPLNQFIQDMTDQVVLMDYRNTAGGEDGFIALGMDEVVYAKEAGKLVTIGLETTFQEPAKITFFGLGEDILEQEIANAQPIFASLSSFDGIAIHDYDGYKYLASTFSEAETVDNTTIATATETVLNYPGETSCNERVSIGARLPNAVICSLQYTINDGPTQTIYNNGVIPLQLNDVFKITNYTYFAPEDTPLTAEQIAVEAYLFKGASEPDYSDGRFTPRGGAVIVFPGENSGGNISGSGWTIQEGWNRLIVVLVHYYPPENNETDDRFYVSFSIQ